jgi:hypothetical protein
MGTSGSQHASEWSSLTRKAKGHSPTQPRHKGGRGLARRTRHRRRFESWLPCTTGEPYLATPRRPPDPRPARHPDRTRKRLVATQPRTPQSAPPSPPAPHAQVPSPPPASPALVCCCRSFPRAVPPAPDRARHPTAAEAPRGTRPPARHGPGSCWIEHSHRREGFSPPDEAAQELPRPPLPLRIPPIRMAPRPRALRASPHPDRPPNDGTPRSPRANSAGGRAQDRPPATRARHWPRPAQRTRRGVLGQRQGPRPAPDADPDARPYGTSPRRPPAA